MGSISRLNISYLNLGQYLKTSKSVKIGTSSIGKSIYKSNIKSDNSILVFGNEANGISDELFKIIDFNLSIPRFQNHNFPESLNLASSLAIILGEIKSKEI